MRCPQGSNANTIRIQYKHNVYKPSLTLFCTWKHTYASHTQFFPMSLRMTRSVKYQLLFKLEISPRMYLHNPYQQLQQLIIWQPRCVVHVCFNTHTAFSHFRLYFAMCIGFNSNVSGFICTLLLFIF